MLTTPKTTIMTVRRAIAGLSIIVAIATAVFAQDERKADHHAGEGTWSETQKVTLNFTAGNDHEVTITNSTTKYGDADFVGYDKLGNVVIRRTIELYPGMNKPVSISEVFEGFAINDLGRIDVQLSIRPTFEMDYEYRTNPIAFFSQQDGRWASNRLGTCRNETIKSAGCAISAIAMAMASRATNLNPASLNTWLANNSGYSSGCLVKWARAADFDGPQGATYVGSGSVSVSNLKSNIDAGRYLVVKSTRFPTHYAVIVGYDNQGSRIGDFFYYDPWDRSAVKRKVGDGWVSSGNSMQIYQ